MLPEFDKNTLSDEELLEAYTQIYPGFSAKIAIPNLNIGFSNNIDFARLLMIRDHDGDREWANKIMTEVVEKQTVDDSMLFGNFPTRNSNVAGDRNSSNFILPSLLKFHKVCRGWMGAKQNESVRRCIDNTVVALERRWDEEIFVLHRDFKGYTNIFLEYCSCLLMAGETLGVDRLRRKAIAQWRRWFHHIAYYGIDEFISPRYYEIGAHAMARIYSGDTDDLTREQCRLTMDHYFIAQHAAHHPKLGMPLSAGSRDYRKYLTPGKGEVCYINKDFYPPYRMPGNVREEYNNRTYPHRFSGRSTAVPFRFQGYHDEISGLATSSGGNYFPQQVFCMAAAGESPENRAIALFPGKQAFVNGYTHQIDQDALCVFNRGVSTYSRTQMMLKDSSVRTDADPRVPHMNCGFLNAGWDLIVNREGLLLFRAYDRELRVFPFAVINNKIKPIALEEKADGQTNDVGEPLNLSSFEFATDLEWFGMFVRLSAVGSEVPMPEINCEIANGEKRFSADEDFLVRLIEYPGGEHRQLYNEDMNSTPLFTSPSQTLWPGELAATALESANGDGDS